MKKIFTLFIITLLQLPSVAFATVVWSTGAYSNNENISKVLSINGATSLIVTVTGETEQNYDFITIYDANGVQAGKFSGSINQTLTINTSSIRVVLTSDYSVTKNGVNISISTSSNELEIDQDGHNHSIEKTFEKISSQLKITYSNIGSATSEIQEYSTDRWDYLYQTYKNYALFWIYKIHSGLPQELTSGTAVEAGTVLLVDTKIQPAKTVYNGKDKDLFETMGVGGAQVCEANILNYVNINQDEIKNNQQIIGEEKYYKVNVTERGKLVILTSNDDVDAYLLYEDCSKHGDSSSHAISTNLKRLRRYVDPGTYYIKLINKKPYSTHYFNIETVLLKNQVAYDTQANTCFYAETIHRDSKSTPTSINGNIANVDRDVFKIETARPSEITISVNNPRVAFMVYSSQEVENMCGGLYSHTLNGTSHSSTDTIRFSSGRDVFVSVIADGSFDNRFNYDYKLKVATKSYIPPITSKNPEIVVEVDSNEWLKPKPSWIFGNETSDTMALTNASPIWGNHDGDDYYFEDWDKKGNGFQHNVGLFSPYNGVVLSTRFNTPSDIDSSNCFLRKDSNGIDYCYGNQVIINHGNGIYSRFAHMTNNQIVTAGNHVQKGQLIGYMGKTGNTTGQHVHVGFYKVNPENSSVIERLKNVGYINSIAQFSRGICDKKMKQLGYANPTFRQQQNNCSAVASPNAVKFTFCTPEKEQSGGCN